ncbi:hypothetical protein CMO88_05070 [Candidatus Woesearchaeota archaeon]|nr:hypothetical protein [Candidatus Woesearchaeota archaeon]|tara:strand:- start:3774 stop:4181 length:408 start_codon:yes stop_codon:yes gene_type:complete
MGNNPNPKLIDLGIRTIVEQFNKLSFIQTLGSCSGHPLWESNEQYGRPYIEYRAYENEAYTFTQSLIDEVRRRQGLDASVVPKGELHGENRIIFAAYQSGIFADRESIRKHVETFWEDVQVSLQEIIERDYARQE